MFRPHFKRSPFHIPAAFHPLTEKNFAALWVGAFLSNLGFWIQSVAQGWQVLQLTNSAFLLGLVTFIGTVPSLLLSLFGGVIADKFDRRRLLVIAQSVYLCTALLPGILTTLGVIQVWHIVLIALINGTFSSVSFPAWQTFITDLVQDGELKQGIALNSMQFNLSRVIGPAIGGLSIGIFGIAGSYYLNALSYVAVIVPLLVMRPAPKKRAAPEVQEVQSMKENLVQGLLYLKKRPVLLVLLGLQLMIAFCVTPYLTLLPVFAANIFHSGATGLGVMNAVAGFGALLGAVLLVLLASRLRQPVHVLFLLCVVGGMASILFALMPNQQLALPLLVVLGASTVMSNTVTNTTLQSSTPVELRARVISIWIMITFGIAPFGSLVAGTVAQTSGAALTLMLGGAICVLVAGALILLTRKITRPAPRVVLVE
ncbi:MAG TPA: MFS transporter [Ktedonobacteraceae bacterium]|jgi:MFS family permease